MNHVRHFVLAGGICVTSMLTTAPVNAQQQCGTPEECAELAEYQEFLKSYQQEVDAFADAQQAEWQAYVEQTRAEFEDYVANIRKVWGDDTRVSDKKNWIEYSEDLSTQVWVDYEHNEITVKSLKPQSDSDFRGAIEREMAKLLKQTKKTANKSNPLKKNLNKIASPNEQQVINRIQQIFSAYRADDTQVLSEIEELTGQTGTAAQAKALGDMATLSNKEVTYYSTGAFQYAAVDMTGLMLAASGKKTKARVGKIKLSEKWTSLRAKKYKAFVDAFASEWKIEKQLIYSIMFNESSFNPVAISPIPAYGLMQIVPGSAGIDVAKRHFETDVLFSPDFLFEPQNNIAIGVGYLNLLSARYFRKITDPTSRMYCVIAAYNTGPGNVSRAITNTKKLNLAITAVNKMTPEEVYKRLISDLPYDETKNYLKKVAGSLEKFQSI